MHLIIDCLLCHGEGRYRGPVCSECAGDGEIEIGTDADSYMKAAASAFQARLTSTLPSHERGRE